MPYSGPCDWAVCGGQAAGATNSQNPVVLAGTTSGNVIRTLRVDDDGALTTAPGATPQMVEGVVADGGTLAGTNPVLIAGQDGSVVQSILTDTSGRVRTVADPYGGSTSGLADGNHATAYVPQNTAAGAPAPLGVGVGIWNGSAWDRVRSAAAATNTTGTGLLGVGTMAFDGTNYQPVRVPGSSDGVSGGVFLGVIPMLSDGGANSHNRARGNTNNSILTSASRTTTQNVTFTNYNGKAIHVVLDMTDVSAGPSVTLSIEAQDSVSSKWYTLLTGAAVTTVSTNVYKVGPALTAAANAVANDFCPRLLRITVTANNANAAVYSVGLATIN